MPDVSSPSGVISAVPVVAAPEEIDITTAYGLRAALASATREHLTVIVDMSRTYACDTAGLHVLVRAHRRALAQGGELRLVMPSPDVRRIFAITGLDRVLRHFASLDEALARTPAGAGQLPLPSDARRPRSSHHFDRGPGAVWRRSAELSADAPGRPCCRSRRRAIIAE